MGYTNLERTIQKFNTINKVNMEFEFTGKTGDYRLKMYKMDGYNLTLQRLNQVNNTWEYKENKYFIETKAELFKTATFYINLYA